MKMPVIRGSLRPSGDGSIKSFVVILTVIGFLCFIYYKLKLSPACSEYISEIQGNRVEISRLTISTKTLQDKIRQHEAEYARMSSERNDNSMKLDAARISDSDKLKDIENLKTLLKAANEKLEGYGPVASLDDSCLAVETKYKKRIKELENFIRRYMSTPSQLNGQLTLQDVKVSEDVRKFSDDERKLNNVRTLNKDSEIEDNNVSPLTVEFISKKPLADNLDDPVVKDDDTLKYRKHDDDDDVFKEKQVVVGNDSKNKNLVTLIQKIETIKKLKQIGNYKLFARSTLKHSEPVKQEMQNMEQDGQKYVIQNDYEQDLKRDDFKLQSKLKRLKDLKSKLKNGLLPVSRNDVQLESTDLKPELKTDLQLKNLEKNEEKDDMNQEKIDLDEQEDQKDNLVFKRNQMDPANEMKQHLQRDES